MIRARSIHFELGRVDSLAGALEELEKLAHVHLLPQNGAPCAAVQFPVVRDDLSR